MKKDYTDYLQDIMTSVNDIEGFISNQSFEEFKRDKKTVNAVIRSFEIIGEAARNLPLDIKEQYPDVPWSKMSGMRDRMIHEYFGVDLEIIWQTIKEDLSQLKKQLASSI